MVEVVFKHWKTGKPIKLIGTVLFNNPQSERLVLKNTDGDLHDIIKSTIIEVKECLSYE